MPSAVSHFAFKVSAQEKPNTRCGMLSAVYSLYDPFGFVSPVVIQGKLPLRDLISETKDRDEPLAPERNEHWETWRDSLQALEKNYFVRAYVKTSLSDAVSKEVHVFCDASEQAISAVVYLTTTCDDMKQDRPWIQS